jgi:hypothetical protein
MASILTDEELDSILREKYPGPGGARRLAENLISIFGAEHPDGQTVDGPLTIRQTAPDVPALTIVPFPGATVPPFSGGGGGGGGGLPPAQTTFPSTPPPAALAPQFPVMLYGIVVSGSGQTYNVLCWITDPTSGTPLGTFPCFQGQIDPAETIPAGTHCLVWCAIGAGNAITSLRMLVPIYLP